MDLLPILLIVAVAIVVNVALMYVVIKAAVKNALIEDRAFQAKVAKMRAAKTATPARLTADGQ